MPRDVEFLLNLEQLLIEKNVVKLELNLQHITEEIVEGLLLDKLTIQPVIQVNRKPAF